MKSQFQVLSFLRQYKPSTELDRTIITSYVKDSYNVTPKTQIFAHISIFSGLSIESFRWWLDNGYTALEIAKFDDKLGIIGSSNLESAEIIGILEGGTIKPANQTALPSSLSKTSAEEAEMFKRVMLAANLQPNPTTLSLEAKYVPKPKDKVLFHSYDFTTNGIGIVNAIDNQTNDIEFCCYYIYPTKTEKDKLGYSMHEKGIANLHDFIFEPLLEDDSESRFSESDGISAYRRLKRELEREGKIWKDKLYRIEPSSIKRNKGEKYWHINDKLEVVTDTDKGTPTAQKRYIAGNYFISQEAAKTMRDKIQEIIKDYLALQQWPNY